MKTASQNWTCRLSARRRAGQLILFSGLVLLVLIKWVMPQTAELVVQTGHSAYVTYLQISPDAKLIASGDLYSLILWDAKTGRQIRTLTEADSDSEYGIDYRSISFNHDWHFLIDGASLVEVSTGRRTKPFDLPFNTIGASALSTDGKMFVATDLDRRYVGVWSTATGQRAAFYKAEGVTFSQNGDLFAAAGPLLVPSAQEEAAMRRAKNRADEPGNLPKPRRRIRSSDNLIHIFSASTQKEIARISRGPLVPLRMTFGSDNKELISVNTRGLKVWSLPTGRLKQNLNANFETIHVNNAARDYDSAVRFYFSPNGNSMVAAGENEITFWERKSAKLRHRAINNDIELLTLGTGGYAFTPDGEIFVNPRGVDLWDVKSGTVVRSFEAQGDRNVADVPAVFSGNGQMLALGRANEVDIWDLSATIPRKASRFRPIVHTISNVSLGLDGRTLALSSDDELVDPVGTASDITDAINGKRSDAFDDAVLVWHLDGSAAPARIDGALFYSNPFSRGSRLEGPFYHAQNLMACQKTEPQVECSIWDLGSGNLKKLLNGYDTFFGHETAGILGGAADMNLMTLSADLNRIALSTRSDRLEFWDITDPSGFELKNKIQIGRITTWDMIPKTAVWKLTVPGTINSIVFGTDERTLEIAFSDKDHKLFQSTVDATNGKMSGPLELPALSGPAPTDPAHLGIVAINNVTSVILINPKKQKQIAELFWLGRQNWAVVTPEGRFDTNENLDNIDGLHWILSDDPLTPKPLELFMRQYYEPNLLQRLLKCNNEWVANAPDPCEKEFKPLPLIGKINRVQPRASKPMVSTLIKN